MKEIPKTYSPKEVELSLIKFWENNKFYTPDRDSSKPKYSIAIPPPNVTGNLTIGHILNNTIQDIYARWKRMSGYEVLWLPGTDHAGIATQTVVEKKLKEEKLTKYNLGREKFVEKVWEWKKVYHANIKNQLTRMGASVDWSRERFTLDEGLSLAVRKVFVGLYKKGLIYKGKRIINWDPVAQTALSDEEVIYQERKDKLYYIKYKVYEEDNNVKEKFITIATTRPETMLGDTAIAVNPEDIRYTDIIGKKVLLPIVDKIIPVIADKYVDKEFGTGALKITPAHDPNDFEIGQKYNLDTVQVIDHQGKMNENAGKYSGLERFEARKAIIKRLEELDLIEKIDDYIHNVGFSERGEIMVEPYLSDQWFVSMKSLTEPALNAVVSGKIKFYPERWTKVYENWMNNIRDWCISRQLWWGHQIPVWYNKNNGEIYCEINPPTDIENWEQDPDVLDTWFSSWLWPFSTLGWPENSPDLKKFFPTDLLSTGPDIIFFWVARMIIASLEFVDKIPFDVVYFHNIIRDDKGRKLSKSLKNSPDVIEVMEQYGTDALRFTLVYLAPQGVDVYFSKDKCEIGRNFANKIWNASRFLVYKKDQSRDNTGSIYNYDLFDRWIESRLNSTIKDYFNSLSEYKINDVTKSLYEFIWGDFCDWYIEIIKIKTNYNKDASDIILLKAFEIFEKVLKLLHPVMPFISEELWKDIFTDNDNDSISISDFPVLDENAIDSALENDIRNMQELITGIRNLRYELNLSPSVDCTVIINCHDDNEFNLLNESVIYIKGLGKVNDLKIIKSGVDERMNIPKSVSSVINNFQIYIPVEGLIDLEQEINRVSKEIERVELFLVTIRKKLSNKSFIDKAVPEVVENERKKEADSQLKLDKLNSYILSLKQ